ncbi:hypothetical protein [Flavihumibacter petaseus]|uniref:Uncharacterized protein n=1 Tax=Flavihumibacter petaseus NBRC 106054 TaxID=1220578 RepID=A0A0E9MY12_9BACT|nr:hypothetical protein [Flavihumibacter petaseus]GAO42331.1 hypothetical protein FPE01S_01_13450 [Flavihumibacter petaseus NBRC 106054]
MANAKSLIAGHLNGMLGKEIVFRNWEDKTIVAKAPGERTTPPTAPQVKVQRNFTQGSQYAKSILLDPDLVAGYKRALRPRQNVYSRALQDFVTPPEVTDITIRNYTGQVGDIIEVRAVDDYLVTKVYVEIRAANGDLLEGGVAVLQPKGNVWNYAATVQNPALAGTRVIAFANDFPGNEASLEVLL